LLHAENSETQAAAVQIPKLLNGVELFAAHLVGMGKIQGTSKHICLFALCEARRIFFWPGQNRPVAQI
jgi:hypothetical protein